MSGAREAAARRRGRANTPATRGGDHPQGQVATQGDPANTMRHMIGQMRGELATALPKHMDPDKLARHALTAFRTTKKLDECSPASFLGALMTCAQVGLEPGPQGHVYLVPYWNSRARSFEATFILGYQGMIELARRSGELKDISAHTVYANEVAQDRFAVEYGSQPRIVHRPIIFGDKGDPVGYYARATLENGATPFVVLSLDEVHRFRRRSATQKEDPSGPWSTDFEAMAWKTCVRRLSRWLPQSPELAAAVAHEETVRHVSSESGVVTSVLDQQPPGWEDEPAELEAGDGPVQSAEHGEPQQAPPPPDEPAEPDVPEPGGPDDPWANAPAAGGDDPWAGQQ